VANVRIAAVGVARCSRFYTAVVNQALSHDGSPALARHLANATVRETPEGAIIVKDRRNSPRKIDLAIAAVLAYDHAFAKPAYAGPLLEVWA